MCLGITPELDTNSPARRGRGRRRARRASRPRSMPPPKGLSVLVLDQRAFGGQAGASARIENYLGFPTGISGVALAGRAFSQAQKFGAEVAIPLRGRASRLRRPGAAAARAAAARTDGRPQRARAHRRRGVRRALSPAEHSEPLDDFEGAGVSYWASAVEAKLCEGEEIALVGGGNSAGQAVVFLAPKVKHMHLVVRRPGLEATMSRYLIDRIAALPNVDALHRRRGHRRSRAIETGALCSATFRGLDSGNIHTYPLRHLFLFIGADPNGDWLAKRVAVDDKGFVVTGGASRRPTCRSAARRCRSKPASPACSRSATCARARPSGWPRRSARAPPSLRRSTRRWRSRSPFPGRQREFHALVRTDVNDSLTRIANTTSTCIL